MSLNLKKLFKQNSEKNLGFVTQATNQDTGFDPSEVIKKMSGYKAGEEDRAKYRQQQLANYLNTIDKKCGNAYLTREFFDLISNSINSQILLLLAKKDNDIKKKGCSYAKSGL